MRRRDNHVGFGKSFDSFLSIVTKNGLGMLILIAMASTFSNVQTLGMAKFKRSLGTPIIKQSAPGAKGVYFECVNGRIIPVDFQVIMTAERDFFNAFEQGGNPDTLAAEYNAKGFKNDYYTFEFKARSGEPNLVNEPVILFHPRKDKAVGETLAELEKADSLFSKRLQGLDKAQNVVILFVRAESFPFFRDLRSYLQDKGYQISWQPIDKPLWLLRPRLGGGGQIHVDHS
jgi:hypothetical protein